MEDDELIGEGELYEVLVNDDPDYDDAFVKLEFRHGLDGIQMEPEVAEELADYLRDAAKRAREVREQQ